MTYLELFQKAQLASTRKEAKRILKEAKNFKFEDELAEDILELKHK